jgi:hypothetical protein
MNEPNSIQRSRALRLRAAATDKLEPYEAGKYAAQIEERREALDLILEMDALVSASQHELHMLTMMLHEAVAQFLRDTTGVDWKKGFKEHSHAIRHFQAMHAIARYMKLKSL